MNSDFQHGGHGKTWSLFCICKSCYCLEKQTLTFGSNVVFLIKLSFGFKISKQIFRILLLAYYVIFTRDMSAFAKFRIIQLFQKQPDC